MLKGVYLSVNLVLGDEPAEYSEFDPYLRSASNAFSVREMRAT